MSDLRIASVAWLTSVLLIGSAACEGDSQNDPGSRSHESDSVGQNATNIANNGAAGSAQGLGSGTALNAPDAGQSATPLVDPQIISVLSTINAGAIERSSIATDAAQTASVRALAQEVIDTRLAAQERLTRLVAATSFNDAVNVSNAENTVSDTLLADSKSIVARLQATQGSGFDALFLQTQLDVLSAVILVIDERLLPNVESALLRAEIERVRAETIILAQRTRGLLALLGDDADGGVPNDSDAGF
jgi:predicted outer membrane protein